MFKEAIHVCLTQTEQGEYRKAAAFYHRWQTTESQAAANLLQYIEVSLSYLNLPLKEPQHRSKLKTVNKLESFFQELINNIGTFENIKSSD